MCPSNPTADRGITYTIPAGALLPGVPDVSFTEAGLIDYVATTAVEDRFLRIAYSDNSITNTDDHLESWGLGTICIVGVSVMEDPSGGKLRDILDGTSNTTLVGEMAGRNELIRDGQVVPLTDIEAQAASLLGFGGAWSDPFNGSWELSGRLYDGTGSRGLVPSTVPTPVVHRLPTPFAVRLVCNFAVHIQ